MKTSDEMKSEVVNEVVNGESYSENEALIKLLEISSQEAKEGKLMTGEELLDRLSRKF